MNSFSKFLSLLRSIISKPIAILLPIALFFAGWWFGLPSEQPHSTGTHGATSVSPQVWTCSMHPQVRQPSSGLCPICNMDLIPLLSNGNEEAGLRELTISPEAASLLDIRVSPAVKSPAQMTVSMFGKIDYDERRTVTTSARMAGRLDRLFADFTGTTVSKGDAIAKIYSPQLVVDQYTLINAKNEWLDAKSKSGRASKLGMLEIAREKMRLLNLSEKQIVAIEGQKVPKDHITLLAPQSGVIVSLNVKEGDYVKRGDSLFSIADMKSVWLRMEAYESDLQWLRYAQDVTFTVEAIPGRTFHGPIAFIDTKLDPNRRITKVRVNVANEAKLLKPGMFANALVKSNIALDGAVLSADLAGKWISPMHPEIIKNGPGSCDICGMPLVPAEQLGFIAPSSPIENPLLIPVSAVLRTGSRAVVYVRIPDETEPTFVGREINLGSRVGDFFIVNNGLSEGELVVTNGAYKLDSELQIKAQPSMMNPNAGLKEYSSKHAPLQITGQWSAILRIYGKITAAMQNGNSQTASNELGKMQSALRAINHDQLQAGELALWNEFSMRLDNTLDEVSTMPTNRSSLELLNKQFEEVRRFTGLSSIAIAPMGSDKKWLTALASTKDHYLTIAKLLAADQRDATLKALPGLMDEALKLPSDPDTEQLRDAVKHLNMQNDIAGVRKAFKPVSDALISLVRKHGLDQLGDLFVVHCPMADDGKGADWLSEINEVQNPYFGAMMLGCGSVTDTLSSK